MSGHLLFGAFGAPNFGDEAILAAWIDAIRQIDPDARLFCDGHNFANLSAFAAGRAQVLAPQESLWHALYLFDRGSADCGAWPAIAGSLAKPDVVEAAARVARGLRAHDIGRIHFLGGGYLNALWPQHYALLVLARLIAWSVGMRIVATGQGLCPAGEQDRAGLAELLATFDHVDVRDAQSLQLLAPVMRATCSGDDALLHFASPSPGMVRRLEAPALVVCLQHDLYDGAHGLKAITASFEAMVATGIRHLVLVEAAPGDIAEPDAALSARCRDAGWTIETVRNDALLRDGLPVHPAGVTVTSRFHPHLLAMLAGARGIALAANPYYAIKHASVRQAGSNWPVLSGDPAGQFVDALDEVLAPGFRPHRPDACAAAIDAKRQLAKTLYKEQTPRAAFPIDTVATLDRLLQREQAASRAAEAGAQARHAIAEALERQQANERTLRHALDAERQVRLEEAAGRADERQARLAAEAHVARLRGSLSWRLTRPLRRLKRMLRPA